MANRMERVAHLERLTARQGDSALMNQGSMAVRQESIRQPMGAMVCLRASSQMVWRAVHLPCQK